MIDLLSLLNGVNAYKTVFGDKNNGKLSHAYLIICPDGDNLEGYLKIFASVLACREGLPCGDCRNCRLIEEKAHPDVFFYPKGQAVATDDVNSLIEESFVKPIENDKKIFVINHAETMNATAQNKLLKTLEEPPKGVHIIIGATSEFPLLSTVKSRVKKLEIPPFSSQKLFDALISDCPDSQRLNSAIACGDGTVGTAVALYGDQNLSDSTALAISVLKDMKSSADVIEFSNKVSANKGGFNQFLSVIETLLRDLLVYKEGKGDLAFNQNTLKEIIDAEKFPVGAILYALEGVTEVNKRKKFNANATMLTEWFLFHILEGKYKWQKL